MIEKGFRHKTVNGMDLADSDISPEDRDLHLFTETMPDGCQTLSLRTI